MPGTLEFGEIKRTADGRVHLPPKISDGTINPYELMKELAEVEKVNVQIYVDEIDLNVNKKIPAIEDLRAKTKTLQVAAERLTNNLREINSSKNVLGGKCVNLKVTDDAVSIRATARANASENDHKINVSQIASKDRISLGLTTSLLSDTVGVTGDISINNQVIAITAQDTLASIADKINAVYEQTKVTASLLQTTDSGNYYLVLEADDYASPINFQGTPGTTGSLFGLAPTANTVTSSLLDSDGNPALADDIKSGFYCADPTLTMTFNGTLYINGEQFALTPDVTTLDALVTAINGNATAAVTASVYSKTVEGSTVYGLELVATTLGIPIDFTSTSATLLGLIPASPDSSVNSGAYDSLQSGFKTTDANSAMEYSGNLVLNNETFTVTNTTTLNELVAMINENTNALVAASIVLAEGSTTHYCLQLVASEMGQAIGMKGTAGTDSDMTGSNGLKIPASNTTLDNLLAKFTFDSIEMTRKTNSISNVLTGVTFTLNSQSTKDSIFDIEYSKGETATAISQFVDAYNEVVKAIAAQSKKKPDGSPHDDAVLYGDRLLSQLQYLLQGIKGSPILGDTIMSSSYVNIMSIGIVPEIIIKPQENEVSGLLKIDTEKLISCLSNKEYKNIIQLFGNYAQSLNPNFSVLDVQTTFSTSVLGRAISVNYAYVGATSTDETFSSNFSVPQPSTPLGTKVAGQTISVTYQQNLDGSFSAQLSGIEGQASVIVENITDGIIQLPTDSIFKGLTLNFIGTAPDQDSPITTTVTLPDFVATLSCEGQTDVVVHGVSNNLILGPKGSIYEGLALSYNLGRSTPLVMGGTSAITQVYITRGIAVNFSKSLAVAIEQHAPGKDPVSLFDQSVDILLEKDELDKKLIRDAEENAERKKKILEPLLNKLYLVDQTTRSINQIINLLNNRNRN